jgi:hypothetical protein
MLEDKQEKAFLESKALRERALDTLNEMKNIEKRQTLTTIKLPNGMVVKANNQEFLDNYIEKYGNKL